MSLLMRRHPVSCWLKRLSFKSLYLSFFSALDLSLCEGTNGFTTCQPTILCIFANNKNITQ